LSKEPEAVNLSSWYRQTRKIFCEHYTGLGDGLSGGNSQLIKKTEQNRK
jgi:hypothetical protein